MPAELLTTFPRRLVALACVVVLSGCKSLPDKTSQDATEFAIAGGTDWERASCSNLERLFSDAIVGAGLGNARARPFAVNPLLKVDRFLLSLASDVDPAHPRELAQWTELAAGLAAEVRAAENANLTSPWPHAAMARLDDCSKALGADADFAATFASQPVSPERLSNYSHVPRLIGFYPLLRPVFRARIRQLHAEERIAFERPTSFSRSTLYFPPETSTARVAFDSLPQAHDNPLGVPVVSEDELSALFRRHAPAMEIEQRRKNDRIGTVVWQDGTLDLDLERAVAYTYPSYTRFEGRNLLQLNYQFWFPARDRRALIDLYSGFLDGLIWRVTLDSDGEVLLYDSIHSCGCYHKYFLTENSRLARKHPVSAEPAIIFDGLALAETDTPKLQVSSNEHYITGIEAYREPAALDTDQRQTYRLEDYSELSVLPRTGNRSKSMFDPAGLVAGSERLERFTLWPTGIPSVGTMRQRGNHAIGFVAEQHFDDPGLLAKYFRRRDAEPSP